MLAVCLSNRKRDTFIQCPKNKRRLGKNGRIHKHYRMGTLLCGLPDLLNNFHLAGYRNCIDHIHLVLYY